MKKLVLIALTALMMVGCKVENGSVYTTTTIDSCEYIIQGSLLNKAGITHKGNCRFCQQRLRQMMWEVQDLILNTMD